MPETKSSHDFICDGVLNYGVDVGRFVFRNTGKVVYAVSDLPHIGASDVLMFYQISKLNYQRLLAMSLLDQIPDPPVPSSVTDSCRRRFLCGESAYCERIAFSVFQAEMALTDDIVSKPIVEEKITVFRTVRKARTYEQTRPLASLDDKAGWVLIRAGKLKTLSKGMGYYLYRRPDGKIVCETLCGESIIADSTEELQRMTAEKLELLIYSSEMDRAR